MYKETVMKTAVRNLLYQLYLGNLFQEQERVNPLRTKKASNRSDVNHLKSVFSTSKKLLNKNISYLIIMLGSSFLIPIVLHRFLFSLNDLS